MKLVIISDKALQLELLAQGLAGDPELRWQSSPITDKADACIDLLFDDSEARLQQLKQAGYPLVIINTVSAQALPPGFVAINGWPGFLSGNLTEAASAGPAERPEMEKVWGCFQKKPEWLPATPGFVTPRVISMIINEAYLALEENVSTRAEIDTAMKLGTGYPFGPFEWAERIGLKRVYSLLNKLSAIHPRYSPAPLLVKEANA